MKSSRVTLDIISILVSLFSSIVFVLPVWYFKSSTTINEETTIISPIKAKLFNQESMNKIIEIYKGHNSSIDLTFLYIFEIMCVVTLTFSFVFVILTILSMFKKLSNSTTLFKISKIVSISIVISSLLALTSALIFTGNSKKIITDSSILNYTLFINITSGIYMFTLFTVFSGVVGYVANNIKQNDN